MGAIDDKMGVTRHRLTVDEYYRMAEVGLLAADARVELIDGEIVHMPAIGSKHAGTVRRLDKLFQEAVGHRVVISVQAPLRLDRHNEPEPDLMLLRPREDFYARSHPTASDVLLLIEVSDTTARYDREIKLELYARYGIPETWIFDLDSALLRQYRRPADARYLDIAEATNPGVTPIAMLAGVAVDLSGLLSLGR